MAISMKSKIYEYIQEKYSASDPIVPADLYSVFSSVKPVTIRQTLIRLSREDKIIKSDKIRGVYFLSNPNRILDTHTLNFNKLIEQKYLKDTKGEIIGYETGFSVANKLGLTNQVPNVTHIYSNAVADKLREIRINNRRFVVNSPRIKVTSKNYKLLQFLDIIGDFKKYSERTYSEAFNIFEKYLLDLELKEDEIDEVISSYPIKTQLEYYKRGADHVLTSKSRGI